jgi:hypothetical protein
MSVLAALIYNVSVLYEGHSFIAPRIVGQNAGITRVWGILNKRLNILTLLLSIE